MPVSLFLRSPHEERLFALGWKDNCYSYGDPDTYMAHPRGTLERRRLNAAMAFSRGKALVGVDGAHAASEKEGETEDLDELLDELVRRDGARPDEDMFLPQPMSSLIQSLPSLLRESRRGGLYQQNWTSNQLLERRKL